MVPFFSASQCTHPNTHARAHPGKRTHTVLYTVNLTMEGAKGGKGQKGSCPSAAPYQS